MEQIPQTDQRIVAESAREPNKKVVFQIVLGKIIEKVLFSCEFASPIHCDDGWSAKEDSTVIPFCP